MTDIGAVFAGQAALTKFKRLAPLGRAFCLSAVNLVFWRIIVNHKMWE